MCIRDRSFIIHHILPNQQSLFIFNQPSTINNCPSLTNMVVRPFHSWNKYSSSFINYPITHHPTAPSPSNVTHKLSTMNDIPSALINHPSHIPIPHLISLITFDFCHSPMTNQRSPIIHFRWTYHSPYFNHYPAPISFHSTPIIDYPLPI